MKTIISAIAAIGEHRELGKDNKLLWHIPEDLQRFKQLTTGHPVIMGRKTFESLNRPQGLPNRLNIIITRDASYKREGIIVCSALKEAIQIAKEQESRIKSLGEQNTKYEIQNTENEVFIIGGGQMYQEALSYLDRLYLTVVHQSFDADVFFPEYEKEFTTVIEKEDHKSGEYQYTNLTLEK